MHKGQRQVILSGLHLFYYCLLLVPWAGYCDVIVVFPDHTHMCFEL